MTEQAPIFGFGQTPIIIMGMIADSELEPIAKLSNYDNDNLTGNEFVFQTISGV